MISTENKIIYTLFFFFNYPVLHSIFDLSSLCLPLSSPHSIFLAYIITSCHRHTAEHFYFISFACTRLKRACSCVLCDVLSSLFSALHLPQGKRDHIILYIQAQHNTQSHSRYTAIPVKKTFFLMWEHNTSMTWGRFVSGIVINTNMLGSLFLFHFWSFVIHSTSLPVFSRKLFC